MHLPTEFLLRAGPRRAGKRRAARPHKQWPALLLALALAPSTGATAEELITLKTRDTATQSYLLAAPGPGKTLALAVLFSGGDGKLDLPAWRGNTLRERGNFLVRSRQLFVDRGVATAVVGAPTDHADGMPNSFRKHEMHAQDVQAVIGDLKRRFAGAPVFLIGTSMGTVSAAYVGRALAAQLAGVALTASAFVASGRRSAHGDSNLAGFDFDSIKAPLIFVHHSEDGCGTTPYAEARRHSGRHPLISVTGGHPPHTGPCEALSAHGFLGREEPTVDAIVNWMLKKPYPKEIK
ncbi:MAG: alpha/beta hydrolase [Betaproteobacteria bacterium]|nr:alpha/beta hydrolase [Betaproteobacteria bacterium]